MWMILRRRSLIPAQCLGVIDGRAVAEVVDLGEESLRAVHPQGGTPVTPVDGLLVVQRRASPVDKPIAEVMDGLAIASTRKFLG